MKKQNQLKRTIVCFFILFSIGFLTNCEKEDVSPVDSYFDYEQIGIDHNKGLDYIFEYLKEEGAGKTPELRNPDHLLKLTKEATIDYSSKSFKNLNFETEKLCLILQRFTIKSIKSSGTIDLVNSIGSEIELTPIQTSFLKELDEIISNIEVEIQPTFDKIKNLESSIFKQCTYEESIVLLSATSVARYSLDYWINNYEKWITELSYAEGLEFRSNKSDDDWEWFWDALKDMGKSDLAGAAIGAGVGALAGGVGAAPGAVASACYSSAGRGIVALTEHWGLW